MSLLPSITCERFAKTIPMVEGASMVIVVEDASVDASVTCVYAKIENSDLLSSTNLHHNYIGTIKLNIGVCFHPLRAYICAYPESVFLILRRSSELEYTNFVSIPCLITSCHKHVQSI